jgi:hypothetical protein
MTGWNFVLISSIFCFNSLYLKLFKHIIESIRDVNIYIIVLGTAMLLSMLVSLTLFELVSKNLTYELKWRSIKAILSQEVEWYDSQQLEILPTTINDQISQIEVMSGLDLAYAVYF